MEIKDILKQKRKSLGLTMKDVARACDVSEATVSRWESGNIGDMKRSRIAALADYEENIEYLKNQPELLELYKEIVENDQLAILFDKAKKLEPKDLEQILKIIDTFNKETRWLYGIWGLSKMAQY